MHITPRTYLIGWQGTSQVRKPPLMQLSLTIKSDTVPLEHSNDSWEL